MCMQTFIHIRTQTNNTQITIIIRTKCCFPCPLCPFPLLSELCCFQDARNIAKHYSGFIFHRPLSSFRIPCSHATLFFTEEGISLAYTLIAPTKLIMFLSHVTDMFLLSLETERIHLDSGRTEPSHITVDKRPVAKRLSLGSAES